MNAKTKHTPGPWSLFRQYSGQHQSTWFIDAHPNGLKRKNLGSVSLSNEANARLIAEAPEMKDSIVEGVEHAAQVVARWSSGDLAGAVNALEEWAGGAKAILAKIEGAAS